MDTCGSLPEMNTSAVLHSLYHLIFPWEGTWGQATDVLGPARQLEQGGVTWG